MLIQQMVGGEWTKDDQIYIVLTEDAKYENWTIDNDRTRKTKDYDGLKCVLERMHLSTPIKTIDIPDGINEKELWEVFDKIYRVLEIGDELYFDLTHGFRYLPMMVLVLGNYAKFLKQTEVKSITYGNYETRDTKTNIAPIIDITPLAALQDWTNAAADYINHGDAKPLYSQAQDKLYFFLRNPNDNKAAAQVLNNLCRNIAVYCDNLSFNRGMSIIEGKEGSQVKSYLEIADASIIAPLQPLFDRIRTSVDRCTKNSPANMIYAAEICADQKNYQQAMTLLREGIISIICARHGIKQDDNNKREAVVAAILKHLSSERTNKSDKDGSKLTQGEYDRIIEDVYSDPLLSVELAEVLDKILTCRNDFNHAGMRSNREKVNSLREKIHDLISRSKMFLDGYKVQECSKRSSLLVNLSNHPYERWSEEQKEAAKEYGEVRDMPFPNIDPEEDTEQIRKTADEYISEVVGLSAEYAVTVHLMGEMSFVVYAVSRLSERGIRCICSTSERDVDDLGGGEKKVAFHFKRFRDYDC